MGAPRLPHRTRTSAIFGKTADYVLRHAPCRVMIAAAQEGAPDARARLVVFAAATFVGLGVALVVQTARTGGGIGYLLGVLFVALGVGTPVPPARRKGELMARKLPVLQRVLGAPTLFSVAYGEIASSIYFALGIIAGHALGLTPQVLLLTGLLFLVVALSYAEGITAIPETGGAATLVRKAFNDFAGFCTGWVLFLDYIIVITLSALFLPHYLGGALEIDALQRHPWDVVVGVAAILAIAVVRLFRRPGLYTAGIGVAVLDLVTQLLVVVLGLALLFSPDALTRGVDLGLGAELVRARLRAAARDARLHGPGDGGQPRRGGAAARHRHPAQPVRRDRCRRRPLHRDRRRRALGVPGVRAARPTLGGEWLFAPLLGIVEVLGEDLSPLLADALRVFVGVSGALILLAAATTSVSGFGRLAYSLGEHGMLPRTFGRLGRRTLISPAALASVVVIAAGA